MKAWVKGVLAGAGMLALSATAYAQDEVPASGAPSDPTYQYQSPRADPYGASDNGYGGRRGLSDQRGAQMDNDLASKVTVAAGAGLSDFTGSLGDHTNAGLGWNVRGGYDFSRNLGLEVGYLGARNGIDDATLPTAHSITTTGLNGDLKLMAPMGAGNVTFKPYVFGGVGAAYYGVSGDVPGYQSDSNVQIPVGIGGDAFLSRNVSVGARAGYYVNLANRIGDDAAGNQYNLTANLGVHY